MNEPSDYAMTSFVRHVHIAYPMAGPAIRLTPAEDGLVRLRLVLRDVDFSGAPCNEQPMIVDTPIEHGLTDRQAVAIESARAITGRIVYSPARWGGGLVAIGILDAEPCPPRLPH